MVLELYYVFGLLLILQSLLQSGISLRGLYRYSRNPMYIAYFIYILSCVLLTQSSLLLLILVVFQIATHWIILAEENWCKERFHNDYIEYMEKTRRYL